MEMERGRLVFMEGKCLRMKGSDLGMRVRGC